LKLHGALWVYVGATKLLLVLDSLLAIGSTTLAELRSTAAAVGPAASDGATVTVTVSWAVTVTVVGAAHSPAPEPEPGDVAAAETAADGDL